LDDAYTSEIEQKELCCIVCRTETRTLAIHGERCPTSVEVGIKWMPRHVYKHDFEASGAFRTVLYIEVEGEPCIDLVSYVPKVLLPNVYEAPAVAYDLNPGEDVWVCTPCVLRHELKIETVWVYSNLHMLHPDNSPFPDGTPPPFTAF